MNDRLEALKGTDPDVRAHAGLVRHVAEHLDLDQGLAEVRANTDPDVRAHAGLVRHVAEHLDLDDGLTRIQTQQSNPGSAARGDVVQRPKDRAPQNPPVKMKGVPTWEHRSEAGLADRLGIEPGMVVQEIGWDEDVDDDVRAAIEEKTDLDLLDEDADELVDVILLWWREDDGDLADTLSDLVTSLADEGVIWILTPRTGRDGHVEPHDITEAVRTVGLTQTSELVVGPDWSGTRLVSPKTATSTLDSPVP